MPEPAPGGVSAEPVEYQCLRCRRCVLWAESQATRGFWLVALTVAVSVLLVIWGTALCSLDPARCTKETPSAFVAVAAGLLGQLVAVLLFLVHSRTLKQMGDTHRKLALRTRRALSEPTTASSRK